MQEEFEMSMMGELKFFLGIQVNQSRDEVYVHQTKYTKELSQEVQAWILESDEHTNASHLHLKQRIY